MNALATEIRDWRKRVSALRDELDTVIAEARDDRDNLTTDSAMRMELTVLLINANEARYELCQVIRRLARLDATTEVAA